MKTLQFEFSGSDSLDAEFGFAISTTSLNFGFIFALMKQIISIIIDRHGESRIQFRVFVYGSITTTRFTFGHSKFTQEDLRRAVNEASNETRVVNETQEAPGTTDLQQALKEAEILCNLTSRPNVTKAFIVLDSETESAYRV